MKTETSGMKEETYGNTPAALVLYKLIKDNASARRKVSTTLAQLSNHLWQLALIKDRRLANMCMERVKDHAIECLDKKTNLSPEIRSYTSNVIWMRYRTVLRAYNENWKAVNQLTKNQK